MNQTRLNDNPDDVAQSICFDRRLNYISLLGQGSFKKVYRVEQPDGTQLALKVLMSPTESPRVQREIESLLKCNHSTIAKLHVYDEHNYNGNQYRYLLEEFLQGGTLDDHIRSHNGLEEEEVLRIALPLVAALQHLKELDLVHRDIKPANIMFRHGIDTPVLVDFGCVRDLTASSLTQTYAQMAPGTPFFASPEQLHNDKLLTGWRSDQFSLGVTLFYARFIDHPYRYPDEPISEANRVVQRVNRHDSFRPDLSQYVDGSRLNPIPKMIAPWPDGRYRTPTDLAKAWSSV